MKTCLAMIATLGVTAVAAASYPAPKPAETYYVVADSLHLKRIPAAAPADKQPQPPDDFLVIVRQAEGEWQWGVNLFWLADQINSDSICTGTHEKEMTKYLNGIEEELRAAEREKRKPPKYVVRVVSERKGGPLFVAGVFEVRPEQDFERSLKFGSPMLQMTPEQVQALKTVDNYVRRLQEQSELNFAALRNRKEE